MDEARTPAPIYLDYAATTPVDPRVAAEMLRYLTPDGCFANPASGHRAGREAHAAVEHARAEVAALIGARPHEIVWTSGATEATNLALKGAVQARAPGRGHLITCASEHLATLDTCEALAHTGVEVTRLAPAADGRLDPARVAAALRPDTVLVSLMHVNNETGVAHDLPAIGALLRRHDALLHVDAAQSAGKLGLDVTDMGIDLMSLSAHKVYGPKGVGALYVREHRDLVLQPLLHGGGQERGLRAGTLATHQLVGMGAAFRLAGAAREAEDARIRALRERLWQALAALGGVHRNGVAEPSVAGILNVSIDGVPAEDLLLEVDNIALSTGSACSSRAQTSSHVLRAMGLDDERAYCALRLSLGRYTTAEEIDTAAHRLATAVAALRAAPAPAAFT